MVKTRRRRSDEERLVIAREKLSKASSLEATLRNRIAQKKAKESLDKKSALSIAIRGLKALILAHKAYLEDKAPEPAHPRLIDPLVLSIDELAEAVKKEIGVDYRVAFKTRKGATTEPEIPFTEAEPVQESPSTPLDEDTHAA